MFNDHRCIHYLDRWFIKRSRVCSTVSHHKNSRVSVGCLGANVKKRMNIVCTLPANLININIFDKWKSSSLLVIWYHSRMIIWRDMNLTDWEFAPFESTYIRVMITSAQVHTCMYQTYNIQNETKLDAYQLKCQKEKNEPCYDSLPTEYLIGTNLLHNSVYDRTLERLHTLVERGQKFYSFDEVILT